MEISLCMIVKNETMHIRRLLAEVERCRAIRELIIVDTGSIDDTKNLIANFASSSDLPVFVYDFVWVDDFSKARNYAFSKATKEWIMWLDADDTLPDKTVEMLNNLVLPQNIKVVMCKYVTSDVFEYHRERLVRRSANLRWCEPVHETINHLHIPPCDIQTTDIQILHSPVCKEAKGDRNLDIFEAQDQLSPRSMYYYGRELFHRGRFAECNTQLQAFLKTEKGWFEDNISACYILMRCNHELKDDLEQLRTLMMSFNYDIPRPEGCCLAGDFFLKQKDYALAAKWYKMATYVEFEQTWGFTNHYFRELYPYIQLCLCLSTLGDYASAYKWHLKAKELAPDNPLIVNNDNFFEGMGYKG